MIRNCLSHQILLVEKLALIHTSLLAFEYVFKIITVYGLKYKFKSKLFLKSLKNDFKQYPTIPSESKVCEI